MKNKYCPVCGGIVVFIIASDNTLCLPQCENGFGHLSQEEAEYVTKLANIDWKIQKLADSINFYNTIKFMLETEVYDDLQ